MRTLVITMLALAVLSSTAEADRRKYVWTYQYVTIAPGTMELEFYQTTRLNETDSWEYRIEVEHGLAPRWDISVYQIFAQNEGEAFKWDAFQVRTRYKLAPQGRLLFDPLLYLEYRRKIDFDKQNKLEAKLIIARDFAQFNAAANFVYEFFWAPGDPIHEIGLDLGVSREFSYRFTIGVESTSRHEFLPDGNDESSTYLGPTVSLAAGPAYYTVGWAWGLTDASDDARVRFLMGVGL